MNLGVGMRAAPHRRLTRNGQVLPAKLGTAKGEVMRRLFFADEGVRMSRRAFLWF